MPTYQTRKESYMATDRHTRYKEIFGVLHGGMTAREIAYKLGYSDLNAVKPRLTELMQSGVLHDAGMRWDDLTGRHVTVYEVDKVGLEGMMDVIDSMDDDGESIKFIAAELGTNTSVVRAVYNFICTRPRTNKHFGEAYEL